MKIIGLSQNIIWKKKKKIFFLIEEKFKDLEAGFVLLPEMFTTGFYMKAQEVADEEESSFCLG